MTFDISTFNISEYNRILDLGLSQGLGERGEQVCIEAAICQVLGLDHGDDPGCVAQSIRLYKITLNDSSFWSSPKARADGLRELGLAQLGSLGVIEDSEFVKRISEKTIRVLIPLLFREVFVNQDCLAAADRCESEGSARAADAAGAAAARAARAADAAGAAAVYAARAAGAAAADAGAAAYAVYAAAAAGADRAARAADADAAAAAAAGAAAAAARAARAADAAGAYAVYAARADRAVDKYLKLSASLALEVLRELNSPGIALLKERSI